MKTLSLILVLLSFGTAFAETNDWTPVKTTSDGITVDKKEVPGSSVLAFRGDGVIDAPLTKVATIIFDVTRAPEWIEDLELSKIIRPISDEEWIEYDHVRTPPVIMKDRDFVSKVKLTVDPKKKEIRFLYLNTTDPSAPETKYIRGDLMNTTFVLTSVDNDQHTHVTGEIHCDPKGSVAKWIVNFFQSDWPIDTIRNLRKQAAKSDIKEEPRIVMMMKSGK